jgi:hypothetical protein
MSTPTIVRLSPSALGKAGQIRPAWQPDNFDRPAFYTLNGNYYDVHGRLIVPGVPLDSKAEEVEAEEASPEDSTDFGMPLGTLIALAPTMPMEELRAAAERILGAENVHRSRQQIINQLKTLAKTNSHIDFAEFERDGTKTNFVLVKRFIAARFGKIVTSRRQALGILRDEGIIGMPPKKSTTARPPLANAAEDLAEGSE